MKAQLGYPGSWYNGQLFDDGGLPVHLYPFPVTVNGEGPAEGAEIDHYVCWCLFGGCTGAYDQLGFPA